MLKIVPQVFVDTNVWFSAFYGSDNSEKIVKAHIEGKIMAVVSQQILKELVKNIKNKFPKALISLKRFLKAAPPMIVLDSENVSPAVTELVDKKDQKIFQSVINSKARMFVTGNLKHFKVQEIYERYKIKVVSPRGAIETLFDN